MMSAFHLPAEIRSQILEYVSEADLTVWQMCNALRNIRLTSRAWCQSANELLFNHITLTVERCLSFEVERITKADELSKTQLADFVKCLDVYVSPNYYRYVDEDDRDGGDTVRCMARYLPGCVSRLGRLEVLEFGLPRGEEWARWDGVDWDFPLRCRNRCYTTIHRSLSGSHLPRLTGLGLDLFDICDLDTFIGGSCYPNLGIEDQNETEEKSIFTRNVSQIRNLSLCLKAFPRLADCYGNCERYNRPTNWSRVTTKPEPLLRLFNDIGLPSLETLTIDAETHAIDLDMRNYFIERISLRNMRSIDMNRALLTYEDIMQILDSNRQTLEQVILTWAVDKSSIEPKAVMGRKIDKIRETLVSLPRLVEARIRSPAGYIEIPHESLSEWERRSWPEDGEYYFPYRNLDDLYEF